MEKKTFRFIKNILLPIKSTIEVGPEGVLNKGKFVAWKDMKSCNYSITSINGAMNYIIHYTDQHDKFHQLNFIVAITGSKSKKAMFSEIYSMFHEGFSEHIILPRSEATTQAISRGQEVVLAGATISKKGVHVPRALKKKDQVFIPLEEIQIEHRDGSGGYDVQSASNPKDRGFFQYAQPESRELLATLEKLCPAQSRVYY